MVVLSHDGSISLFHLKSCACSAYSIIRFPYNVFLAPMVFLLCCRGPRSRSPPCVLPRCEQLATPRPTSAVSVVLPPNTVPHKSQNADSSEMEALRNIFGRSPSSHRGYNEAAKSCGSLDKSFKFGHSNSTEASARSQSTPKRIGQKLRQRLSKSSYSARSSKPGTKGDSKDEVVTSTKPAPNVNAGVVFDDLLLSRPPSQGGYDSDAKGVETASLVRRSLASDPIDREYTHTILRIFDSSFVERSASISSDLHDRADRERSSATHRNGSSGQADSKDDTKSMSLGQRTSLLKNGAVTVPRSVSRAHRENPDSVLHLRPREPTAETTISMSLTSGSIHIPATPELKAVHLPSIVAGMPEWRLSFIPPRRVSSLYQGDPEVKRTLQGLARVMEKAKRDNRVTEITGHEDHVENYPTGFEQTKQNPPIGDATIFHGSPSEWFANHRSKPSEAESIHLFNMRIPQRLASTSVCPTSSPSRTNFGSDLCNNQESSISSAGIGQIASYASRTSIEPLRKPSDPRTRCIFEPASGADKRQKLLRKKSGSASANAGHRRNHEAEQEPGTARQVKTVHLAEAEPRVSNSRAYQGTSLGSHRHPNSIAVAGKLGGPNNPKTSDVSASLALTAGPSSQKKQLLTSVGQEPRLDVVQGSHGESSSTGPTNHAKNLVDAKEKVKRWVEMQGEEKSATEEASGPDWQLSKPDFTSPKADNVWDQINYVASGEKPIANLCQDRDESAAEMWERALQLARADATLAGSNHIFGANFDALRELQSRNPRLKSHLRSRKSRAISFDDPVDTQRGDNLFANDEKVHQTEQPFEFNKYRSMCIDARMLLTGSDSSAGRSDRDEGKPASGALTDNVEVNLGIITPSKSEAVAATPFRDFPAWARFPSHTRQKRNGVAGSIDGVAARDFSMPPNILNPLRSTSSKQSFVTQPGMADCDVSASWKQSKLGHMRRRSRSIDFADLSTLSKAKSRASNKTRGSLLKLRSLTKWRFLSLGKSNEADKPKKDHRSSVSKTEESHFRELQPVPGYDGCGSIDEGSRVSLQKQTDLHVEVNADPIIGDTFHRKLVAAGVTRSEPEGAPHLHDVIFRPSVSESAYCSDGTNLRSPCQSLIVTSVDGSHQDDCVEIYRDCVQHTGTTQPDGEDVLATDEKGFRCKNVAIVEQLDQKVKSFPPKSAGTAKSGHAVTESIDSYVSCSIGLTEENDGMSRSCRIPGQCD